MQNSSTIGSVSKRKDRGGPSDIGVCLDNRTVRLESRYRCWEEYAAMYYALAYAHHAVGLTEFIDTIWCNSKSQWMFTIILRRPIDAVLLEKYVTAFEQGMIFNPGSVEGHNGIYVLYANNTVIHLPPYWGDDHEPVCR